MFLYAVLIFFASDIVLRVQARNSRLLRYSIRKRGGLSLPIIPRATLAIFDSVLHDLTTQ